MKTRDGELLRRGLVACLLLSCLAPGKAQVPTDPGGGQEPGPHEIATAGHIEHEQGQILFPKPVDWKCGKLVSRPAPREVHQSVRVLSFLGRTDWQGCAQ